MTPKVETDIRPVETAPGYGDVGNDPVAALRRVAAFRGLTDREYANIAKVSILVREEQDRVLLRGGTESEARAYYFVLKGQVAFAEFEEGTIPEAPKNKKKRVAPLMQVAVKNVAVFDVNEFFANDHVAEARGDDKRKRDLALYTLVPVVLLKMPKEALDQTLASVPKVKEAIEAQAEAAYYRQTFLKLENRSDLLDFYVREGFEYAQAIKVIQTDKCIDCDECVKGCEDRHGISRIERFGPRIGLIQFTSNCRTCYDARCIAPCNFDAIGFDKKEGEVIVYDNCVGCTLCAKACPHDAIQMVDSPGSQEAVEAPDVVAMVKGKSQTPKTVIAAGEEKGKAAKGKKKPKRIANKCDHCLGFSDLACISACPTGAIIQIDPRALFRRDGGLIERSEKYFEPAPFVRGYSDTTGTQGTSLLKALFLIAGIGVLACGYEYAVRHLARSWSLWKQVVKLIWGQQAASELMLTYTSASGMGRWMGYIGAGMMVVSAMYTLRLHVPGLRGLGSSSTWFDFHIVFGLAGPMLSLLHTDFEIFTFYWVSVLWWSVVLVVLTGLVGRYLYTALPSLEVSADRHQKALDEGIQEVADQWSAMTMSANVLKQFLKAQEKGAGAPSEGENLSFFGIIGYLLVSEVRRIKASFGLRFGLMGDMKNAKLRRAAIRLMSRRAALERQTHLIGATRNLLAKWRAFHIGISIAMFVLLITHVTISIWAVGL